MPAELGEHLTSSLWLWGNFKNRLIAGQAYLKKQDKQPQEVLRNPPQ